MNQDQLFQLYEKLYFHELDRREKLSARLNIPLAILVGIIGFLAFMLKNAPKEIENTWQILFWALFLIACLATGTGAWFFKASWFGHTDKLLPTANATEAYRQQLIALYQEFDEPDKLVDAALKKYLYEYYQQFSSENTTNNDARSYHLYRATYAITFAVLIAFAAFIPYFLNTRENLNNDKQNTATATATAASPQCER